ncbi:18002_t:CDS:2, partial [Entrophospora sp. SA101]
MGTILAALKTVVTNRVQVGRLKLHPLDLLLRMSPLAFVQTVIYAYVTGELHRVRNFEYINDNELSLTKERLDDDEIVQMVLDEANNVNNESEGEDIDELKVIATNEDALKA